MPVAFAGEFHVPGSQDQAGWLWWPLPGPGPPLPGCPSLSPAPFHVMLRGTAGPPLGGHRKACVPASPAVFAPRPCVGVLSPHYVCNHLLMRRCVFPYMQTWPLQRSPPVAHAWPPVPTENITLLLSVPRPRRRRESVIGEFGEMNWEAPRTSFWVLAESRPGCREEPQGCSPRSKNGACVQRRPAVPSVWPLVTTPVHCEGGSAPPSPHFRPSLSLELEREEVH